MNHKCNVSKESATEEGNINRKLVFTKKISKKKTEKPRTYPEIFLGEAFFGRGAYKKKLKNVSSFVYMHFCCVFTSQVKVIYVFWGGGQTS